MTAAKPETRKGKKMTAVWIIPIVAAVLGAWMVVYTYMTEGPEIRVTFNTASGLEEGKTVIKFRDVEMGQVKEILLSEDMQSVTAVIKMRREALPLLVADTRFWVVTAQIGGGGISGLDTLLSGAYIQISPGESNIESLEFVGLEEPPLTPIGADGLRLILIGERSSSVSSGDPVLYHGFKVGRVESRTFEPENKQIRYVIFIDAPYDSLVNTSSRFWDVRGISLKAGAGGFEVSTGSLESILIGGVTFGRPPDLEPGVAVDNNTEFRLFPNYDEILDSPHVFRTRYVVSFKQSVKGLLPGSPVEYRGINIGEVERIMLSEMINKGLRENADPQGLPIPVLIYIEPARFLMPDTQESVELMRDSLRYGVSRGLRVSLEKSNLLTGAQVIKFEYYEDTEPATMGEYEGYPTMPTIVTGLSGLETKITRLLDKANGLPLEQTVSSVNLVVAELNETVKAVRAILEKREMSQIPDEVLASLEALRAVLENKNLQGIPEDAKATMEALRNLLEAEEVREIPVELNKTLTAARFQLQGESTEFYQLGKTLKEVESAARALREFLDAIEKKPEALIRGKSDKEQ